MDSNAWGLGRSALNARIVGDRTEGYDFRSSPLTLRGLASSRSWIVARLDLLGKTPIASTPYEEQAPSG